VRAESQGNGCDADGIRGRRKIDLAAGDVGPLKLQRVAGETARRGSIQDHRRQTPEATDKHLIGTGIRDRRTV
jgi:hypothetical protein